MTHNIMRPKIRDEVMKEPAAFGGSSIIKGLLCGRQTTSSCDFFCVCSETFLNAEIILLDVEHDCVWREKGVPQFQPSAILQSQCMREEEEEAGCLRATSMCVALRTGK